MLSICSEYSFARAAVVCRARASEPANGPNPTHTTNTMPITSGSIDRRVLKRVRAA